MNYKFLGLIFTILIFSVSLNSVFATGPNVFSPGDASSNILNLNTFGGSTVSWFDKSGNEIIGQGQTLTTGSGGIVIPNSARTFASTLVAGSNIGNRTITLPIVTSTLATLGANTFTGNQTISGNAIITSQFNIKDSSTGAFGYNALNINTKLNNYDTLINLMPTGTGNITGIFLDKQSNSSGKYGGFIIASNFFSPNSYGIGSMQLSGANNEAINFYEQTTPVFGIDTSNNAGVYATEKFCLDFASNSCGNNYIYDSSSSVMDFFTSGIRDLRLTSDNSVVVGTGANDTSSATGGFLYITVNTGSLSGVPVSHAGTVALEAEGTSNKLCFYNGGWKCALFALAP